MQGEAVYFVVGLAHRWELLLPIPSSSDRNRKPPAIPDRHKPKPKAEKCANRRSRSGRNIQHLSDHHDGGASQGSNGVKVRA